MKTIALLAALVLATVAGACTPDIGGGTYFCGPERLCPPDLLCDDSSFTCLQPSQVVAFSCPAGANASEPDNSLDDAQQLGTLRCGTTKPLDDYEGCIDAASDIDLFEFEYDDECSGADPHIALRVRYPIALAALTVELLDDAGQVIATGELCTQPNDFTGAERVCLEARLSSGTYYIRVATPASTPDCDGDCHFNRFFATMSLPLS